VNLPPKQRRGSHDSRPDSRGERERAVAREIADSVLTAASALEVYRRALARVTPLVGADFASVFLRDDDDPRLLRLACAQNWPQASARFLSEIRVREGRGPTGQAVSRGRPVEVPDVFADPGLREWWEPARELGFVSMTSHPLTVETRILGALSFYYRERQRFEDDDQALLAVAARQLASTAERARTAAPLRGLRTERYARTARPEAARAETDRARETPSGGDGGHAGQGEATSPGGVDGEPDREERGP
jgi:GAF domain-containing protein